MTTAAALALSDIPLNEFNLRELEKGLVELLSNDKYSSSTGLNFWARRYLYALRLRPVSQKAKATIKSYYSRLTADNQLYALEILLRNSHDHHQRMELLIEMLSQFQGLYAPEFVALLNDPAVFAIDSRTGARTCIIQLTNFTPISELNQLPNLTQKTTTCSRPDDQIRPTR